MSDYPEHEKLTAVRDDADTVQHFIDKIAQHGFQVCRLQDSGRGTSRNPHIEEWVPVDDPNEPMAVYFEIDREKLAAEKQAMFEAMRAGAKR